MYTCHGESPTQEDKKWHDKSLPLTYDKNARETGSEMRCPGCKKNSLKRNEAVVTCGFCGYSLSPGEEARYRLYELLK
jgi:hypothetical protein